MLLRVFRATLVALAISSSSQASAASPELVIGADSIAIRTAPGAQVVLLSAVLENVNTYVAATQTARFLSDTDNDGTIVFELGKAVPMRSVWIAVNFTTGELASASPVGFDVEAVEVAFDSRSDAFAFRALHGYALVVRPNTGAWSLFRQDADDAENGANGHVVAKLSNARSIADGTAAPPKLLTGDRVILVNADTLDFYTTVVGR